MKRGLAILSICAGSMPAIALGGTTDLYSQLEALYQDVIETYLGSGELCKGRSPAVEEKQRELAAALSSADSTTGDRVLLFAVTANSLNDVRRLEIDVQTPVMRKLHYLGQAYRMRQLSAFGSGVRIVVSTREVPELASDLERLDALVNDPEAREAISRIRAALLPLPEAAITSVAVTCGDYSGQASNETRKRTP